MNITLKKTLASISLLATFTSNAALITLGGVNALDGSGQTSSFIDPTNAPTASPIFGYNGYFIETFDSATAMGGIVGSSLFNHPTKNTVNIVGGQYNGNCALNSTAAGVSVTGTGSFQVGTGDPSYAAAPAGDKTCFGYTPAQNGALGTVIIDYAGLLTTLKNIGLISKINYFGFYWGSVDTYNDFEFFDGNTSIVKYTGSQLLALTGGTPGSQTSALSNRYVNIAFGPNEFFTKVAITSTGVAGEVDNIAIGLSNKVSAPATLGILGLGLIGIAALQRKRNLS